MRPLPPSFVHPASALRRVAGAVSMAPAVVLAVLLAACAGGTPPARLYQLRADPPGPATAAPTAAGGVWQVVRVQVPAYLDQDMLLLPTGQAGLRALNGHRWAEPLRDAVPRLLRQDLARLLGDDKVWGLPLPAGVQVGWQLQVELQRLDATPAADAVVAQVRWTLADPAGKLPARVHQASFSAPTSGTDPDSLVDAHRRVLWSMAQRIAAAGLP